MKRSSLVGCVGVVGLVLTATGVAHAQSSVRARTMVIVDTSGSMGFYFKDPVNGNDFPGGDGSTSYTDPSNTGLFLYPGKLTNPAGTAREGVKSRLYAAKAAFTNAINGYGGTIDFGLETFDFALCGYAISGSPANRPLCEQCFSDATGYNCLYATNTFSALTTINWRSVSCATGPGGRIIITPGAASGTAILPWFDGIEDHRTSGDGNNSFGNGNTPLNPEMRAVGPTPLAQSLNVAKTQWYDIARAADTQANCRPYAVVLMTDGEQSAGCMPNDPVASAMAIYAANPANRVKVHVIGIATGNSTQLNNIAAAGGTTKARQANSQGEIEAAFADVAADTVKVERCNNADDDCNAICDEPFPDVALSGACGTRAARTCNNGALAGTKCFATGSFVCSADQRSQVCSAPTCATNPALCPTAETCNGIDDDCNGVIDDCTPFVAGSCCTNNCPACSTGVPQPETCNGCDDDCDGTADNNLIDVNLDCGAAIGICTPGKTFCCQQAAPTMATCTRDPVTKSATHTNPDALFCLGGQQPLTEICDTLDNNCNGQTDEVTQACNTTNAGVGICRAGVQQCIGGAFSGPCSGGQGPLAETCDNVDQDCSGVADDNLTEPWTNMACCPTGNNADCCTLGMFKCVAGGKVCVGGKVKGPEVCNGLDDNCNGMTDELIPGNGAPCTSSTGTTIKTAGECRANYTCTGTYNMAGPNGLSCVQVVGPLPGELCNLKDDDCNGLVDDNITTASDARVGVKGGSPCMPLVAPTNKPPCDPGTTACVNGQVVCQGAVGPEPNQCNGISTDCTGTVNSSGNCPTGFQCFQGNCLSTCVPGGEFDTCPGGFVCQTTSKLCIPDGCTKLTCPPDQFCKVNSAGMASCVDPCMSVTCPTGFVCRQGTCVENSCKSIGCPPGQLCLGNPGMCVPDPCFNVTCPTGQFCNAQGNCVNVCVGPCPPGEVCVDGNCELNPCKSVTCDPGEICVLTNGQTVCVRSMCLGPECLSGTACCQGSCKPDACQALGCPGGTGCKVEISTCQAYCENLPPPPRDSIVGAGGGGFACSVAAGAGDGGAGTRPLFLFIVLALLGALARRRLQAVPLIALILAGVALSGCKSNPYCLNCGPGTDGGPVILFDLTPAADLENADLLEAPDLAQVGDGGCLPTNAGVEKCDGVDNDCNGTIDDVAASKLANDSNNCGMCGKVCSFQALHQFGACMPGTGGAPTCVPTTCQPGFKDLNGGSDGCEYECSPTANPDETANGCDGKDNDCNGKVDDPFTTGFAASGAALYDKDIAHCGSCTTICNLPGAVPVCKKNGVTGVGFCGVDHCINNGADTYRHNPANPKPRDEVGCEVHCPVPSSTVTSGSNDCDNTSCSFPQEICDGVDNNCDFTIDNAPFAAADGIGGDCADKCPGGLVVNCRGECKPGKIACVSGVKQCQGSVGAMPESCDSLDNDCNGAIDDPFTNGYNGTTPLYDKDPKNCGGCNAMCTLANATNGCAPHPTQPATLPGQCVVVACKTGFSYAPNNGCGVAPPGPQNGPGGVGCYYGCPVNPNSPETCDGKDNDCDGCADDNLTTPSNFCITNKGVCTGQTVPIVCSGAMGWRCNYTTVPNVEVDGSGNLRVLETKCDGLDGNCNGTVDRDGFTTLTNTCSVGTGACQRAGTIKCNPAKTSSCQDASNNPVTVAAFSARDESCNGKDDNCDGQIDERNAGEQPCTSAADCSGAPGLCSPGTGATKTCACGFNGATCPAGYTCTALRCVKNTLTCYDDDSGSNPHACKGYTDPMVRVGTTYVYRYEATRPDATASSPGGNSSRACANGGVLPWSNVTQAQAAAACAAVKDSALAPLTLCSSALWQTACEGPTPLPGTNLYSYSTGRQTYTAGVCNDVNLAASPAVRATGTGTAVSGKLCYTDWGGANRLYDMSGNLMEWTSTTLSIGSPATTYYKIRGGAFTSPSDGTPPDGTSCEFDFVIAQSTFANSDVGFRCCASNAP